MSEFNCEIHSGHSLSLALPRRGTRSYVQGADIFDLVYGQLVRKVSSTLSFLSLEVFSPVTVSHVLLIAPSRLEDLPPLGQVTFNIGAEDVILFLVPDPKKPKVRHLVMDESLIDSKIQIDGPFVGQVSRSHEFSNTFSTVALQKQLLRLNLQTEIGQKWFLSKIKISTPGQFLLEPTVELRLKLYSDFASRSEILVGNKSVGELVCICGRDLFD